MTDAEFLRRYGATSEGPVPALDNIANRLETLEVVAEAAGRLDGGNVRTMDCLPPWAIAVAKPVVESIQAALLSHSEVEEQTELQKIEKTHTNA